MFTWTAPKTHHSYMSSEAKRIEAVIEHRRNSRLKTRSAEYRGDHSPLQANGHEALV